MKVFTAVYIVALLGLGIGIFVMFGNSGKFAAEIAQKKAAESRVEPETEVQCQANPQEASERAHRGYANEIPLKEAVRLFNEELKCSPLEKNFPELTEDEVIGAIVAGGDGQPDFNSFYREQILKIATARVMPKNSLLRTGSGGRERIPGVNSGESVAPVGIRIYLELNIDPEHGHKTEKYIPVYVIRKFYTGIRPAN